MANIKDIALRVGVSHATVSHVLNGVPNRASEKTKEKVLTAAAEMGYQLNWNARRLVTQKSFSLCFLIPSKLAELHGFMTQILAGCEEMARSKGFSLILATSKQEGGLGANLMFQQKLMDGVIALTHVGDDTSEFLEKKSIPFVLVMRQPSSGKCCFVDTNNYQGAFDVTEHLIEKHHHSKIAFIKGMVTDSEGPPRRYQGYLDALKKHHLQMTPDMVGEGDLTPESGYLAAQKFLSNSRPPTAIFAASDLMATGVIKAIKERGLRIPQDIAVVGFDDHAIAAHTEPPLTTVKQSFFEIGQVAAAKLIGILNKEGLVTRSNLLPAKLIIRSSCGCVEA